LPLTLPQRSTDKLIGAPLYFDWTILINKSVNKNYANITKYLFPNPLDNKVFMIHLLAKTLFNTIESYSTRKIEESVRNKT